MITSTISTGGLVLSEATPDVVGLLLADKRSHATRRAYQADLNGFFRSFGDGNASPEAAAAFLALGVPQVAQVLANYKAGLLAKGLSEATVNRRLAAVRSLLKFSYRLGLAQTDGRGLVNGEKSRGYRDTRGIDIVAMRRLISLPGTGSLRGLRDTALLRLLCENALRRAEICSLNVGDFVPEEKRLFVIGKGRGTQREPVTLSPRLVQALIEYCVAAGSAMGPGGPLFRNLDNRPGVRGGRLTVDGLFHVVTAYGERMGITLTPHRLRHSAITAALDLTGGDVRKVQKLSRHADLKTLTVYDDNREDLQGAVSQLLSGVL